MEDDRQMIEDAQLWAIEHGRFPRSRGASVAGAALAKYHRDLPQIIGASSEFLGRLEINTGESRTTTRRLLDSAMRELSGGGKQSYDQFERQEVMRKTLRDVLVQEAAGHEIERRGGVDPARQLDRDPDRGQGELATATLRRQGVDVDGLFGHMTEHDLVKTSHGSYNKVSLLAHPKLVQALEASEQIMNPEQIAMNRHINAAVEQSTAKETQALPVGRAAIEPRRRFQPAAPVRQPSFGRRVAHMQAMGAGL